MVRRRFALAFLASLLLHLVLATGPGWQPAAERERDVNYLEAQLVRPAAPLPAPPAARTQSRPASRGARAVIPTPAPETLPAAAPEPDVSPADASAGAYVGTDSSQEAPVPDAPPAAAAAPAEDVEIPLPGEGRIRFNVMAGTKGFVAGVAVTTWHVDDTSYSIRNVAETTGLVSLFKRARVTQASQGEVGAQGLVPRQYTLVRDNASSPSEAATFYWEEGKITSLRNGQSTDAELLPGSYDILSLIYQFAWFPPQAATLEIPVATGKSYQRQHFSVLGEETIALALGRFRTLHLRVGEAGENITDLWLGLDYKNLPLRIRHSGRKGDVFEQEAAEVQYGDVRLERAPPPVCAD
jgi:hypothetical protein